MSCLAQVSVYFQLQKAQIQNFRNWIEDNPETSTQSAPNSPIIGLIECSDTATCEEVGTSGTTKESAPGAKKFAPTTEQIPPSAAANDPPLLPLLVVEKLEGQVDLVFE